MTIRHNGIEIDLKYHMICHRGHIHYFRNGPREVMFKAWCAFILGDFSRDKMFEHLHGHQADGGPIHGVKWIDIRVAQWRPAAEKMELQFTKDKRGGHIYWAIEPQPFSIQRTADRILAHVG